MKLTPPAPSATAIHDMVERCRAAAFSREVAKMRSGWAMFGNQEPALHAHVFPRYADEPEVTRAAQPWAFDWGLAPEYSEAVHDALRRRIAEYLSSSVG